jgi:hypothetical protein
MCIHPALYQQDPAAAPIHCIQPCLLTAAGLSLYPSISCPSPPP